MIGFFVLPQHGFHVKLKGMKHEKLRSLSDKLKEVFEKSIAEPNQENLTRLKELYELADYIYDLPDWPFDKKALFSVMGTITIPVIIMLLERLIKLLVG